MHTNRHTHHPLGALSPTVWTDKKEEVVKLSTASENTHALTNIQQELRGYVRRDGLTSCVARDDTAMYIKSKTALASVHLPLLILW